MSISLSETGAERTIMAASFSHTGLIREERGGEDQKSCHRLIMNKTYSDG